MMLKTKIWKDNTEVVNEPKLKEIENKTSYTKVNHATKTENHQCTGMQIGR